MHPGASIAALAGLGATVGSYVYALGDALGVLDAPTFPAQPWVLLAGCLALTLGSLALNATRIWDQAVITGGVALILTALAAELRPSPALTLTVLLLAAALIFSAWESDFPFQLRSRDSIPTRSDLAGASARAAVSAAAASELALLFFFDGTDPHIRFLGLCTAALFALRWSWGAHAIRRQGAFALAVGAVLTLYWTGNPTSAHLVLAAIALTVIPTDARRDAARGILDPILQHPAGPLVASFFVLCAVGGLLLHVPGASTLEGGISSVDAVFTAVSAVCVTGLIVLDTPADFTFTGQAIILALIQLGALGIMSYSAAIIIALGRRLRLRDESLIASSLNAADRSQLRALLTRLLAFTFTCEAVGAALLAILFQRQSDDAPLAIWRGIFTSVSAFCNAGFAIQSDSLIPYQHDPLVLHVVSALIIFGGLSPAAALAAPRIWRRDNRERSAQIKLILSVSAALLVANFVLFAAIEWNNSLASLSVFDRLHNAWMQSVTLRTAGFNSVPFDSLRPATLIIMMASMFIGGSPGGTAGGVKTTTAAVLLLSVVAAVRGGQEVSAFGRRISTLTIDRAAAIATLGMLSVFLITLALLLTQSMPASSALFEAVSALATVGLSIGGTADLDSVGKIVITFAMFVGRVGPLSMFAFLSTRGTRRSPGHPVEPIDVG